jgi:transposase
MNQTAAAEVVVGVDTHKHIHVAVVVSPLGMRLGTITIPTNAKGYRDLAAWACSFGTIRAFGVEGTGSYGAALARFLRGQEHAVIEVNRSDRQLRHQRGKSDPIDAEAAARAVLGGQATSLPKSGTSTVEMIRHLKVARDTAVKARSQSMLAIKALIVGIPSALRERLELLRGKMMLIRHLAALRPGPIVSTVASAKAGLRALAQRWLALDDEIKVHQSHLEALTRARAPDLVEVHGIGSGTAAEMLLLVGDNQDRIRSEAAFAKLCGVCPIPASSGRTQRYRLNRGGNRQANAALYRVVVTRMRGHQPTVDYVQRRTAEGKSKAEIIRCLKRYVAREIFAHLRREPITPNIPATAA